jgi:putative Mn2+ efflux pump MntP
MQAIPPEIIQLYGWMAFIFVGIPAKILYNNAAGLRPITRFAFALTSPVIFTFCMIMTGGWISQVFDALRNTYANIIGAIIGISFAALVVYLWYRLLQSIARKHSPIEECFFPDS